jgi:hypothetical protein
MSTGISVQKATYGIGNSQTDVTGTVAGMIRDGILNVPVSASSLNVTDPAPGQIKTLSISYTINSGKSNTVSEKDGGIISINAPPQRTASGLQIIKAEYGVAGNYQDVTDAVQSQVGSDGSINLKVGFQQVGLPDPDPTKKKNLSVEYTLNGSTNKQVLTDGQYFQLSAPATSAPNNKTPTQNTFSFFGTLFSSVAYFFIIFLHSLSVFTAIEYGNQFISPLLWGGLAFFVPFFSFWALPQITFLIRVFRSDDFIY